MTGGSRRGNLHFIHIPEIVSKRRLHLRIRRSWWPGRHGWRCEEDQVGAEPKAKPAWSGSRRLLMPISLSVDDIQRCNTIEYDCRCMCVSIYDYIYIWYTNLYNMLIYIYIHMTCVYLICGWLCSLIPTMRTKDLGLIFVKRFETAKANQIKDDTYPGFTVFSLKNLLSISRLKAYPGFTYPGFTVVIYVQFSFKAFLTLQYPGILWRITGLVPISGSNCFLDS